MSRKKLGKFIAVTIAGLVVMAIIDAFWIEPWLITTVRVRIGDQPAHRIVHISDIHYNGSKAHLVGVVRRVNSLAPEFVCFTGDLVEDRRYLAECLRILGGIKAPVYGVPGNHEHWSGSSTDEIAGCLEKNGGAWLVDRSIVTSNGACEIAGIDSGPDFSVSRASAGIAGKAPCSILLMHYPEWVDKIRGEKFDLVLAGHSHGGQIRLPFAGAMVRAFNVGRYDKGFYETSLGPMHVNPGIGTYLLPARFFCRPEITLIEL